VFPERSPRSLANFFSRRLMVWMISSFSATASGRVSIRLWSSACWSSRSSRTSSMDALPEDDAMPFLSCLSPPEGAGDAAQAGGRVDAASSKSLTPRANGRGCPAAGRKRTTLTWGQATERRAMQRGRVDPPTADRQTAAFSGYLCLLVSPDDACPMGLPCRS